MTGVLIDIDGVIYEGDRVIPGAASSIQFLQQNQIPHLFLTNTTSKPVAAILDKLKLLGINTSARQVLTPAIAARSWIRAQHCEPAALFVPAQTLVDFQDINQLSEQLDSHAGSVVVGDLGEDWTYPILNRAFRLLIQHDDNPPHLIALGMTKYFKSATGLNLDVAPFVKALEYASGVSPIVLGKPAADFFQQAANMLEIPMRELIMVGDDIMGDIHGAQRCDITALLVKTGKFRVSDLSHQVKPDDILESIAELPEWLRDRKLPNKDLPSSKRQVST